MGMLIDLYAWRVGSIPRKCNSIWWSVVKIKTMAGGLWENKTVDFRRKRVYGIVCVLEGGKCSIAHILPKRKDRDE